MSEPTAASADSSVPMLCSTISEAGRNKRSGLPGKKKNTCTSGGNMGIWLDSAIFNPDVCIVSRYHSSMIHTDWSIIVSVDDV